LNFWVDYFEESNQKIKNKIVEEGYDVPDHGTHCCGFLDCTIREYCKPGNHDNIQQIVYNGKNKCHALKYLVVTLANGMVIYAHGPIEGSLHDITLQRLSKINNKLINLQLNNETQFKIYGDKGFFTMSHIDACNKAQRNHPLNIYEVYENNAMKIARITEELIFGTAIQEFKLLSCVYNNKVFFISLSI
jgi:hypothetical protein